MAELTRDDVRQAVRDELSNTLNDIRTIRDMAQRVDQRTNDLDESQREIRDMYQRFQVILPKLESITNEQQPHDIQDIKLRVQNIEKGIASIVQYLQQQSSQRDADAGYKGV